MIFSREKIAIVTSSYGSYAFNAKSGVGSRYYIVSLKELQQVHIGSQQEVEKAEADRRENG